MTTRDFASFKRIECRRVNFRERSPNEKSILYSLVLFVSLTVTLPAHHEVGKASHFDESLYADLLNDPFKKRFLEIFHHPGINHGGYIFSENEKEEVEWSEEQGVKAFPVLLEILKREPNPSGNSDLKGWNSLQKKKHVLNWIKVFPEGDTQPFVEEVRGQLKALNAIQIATHDSHTGFIGASLNLLAREGDSSDVALIESFLDDVNRNNRLHAVRTLEKIKRRLNQKQNGGGNRIEPSLIAARDEKNISTDSSSQKNKKPRGWLYWVLGTLILSGLGVLVWNRRKGASEH